VNDSRQIVQNGFGRLGLGTEASYRLTLPDSSTVAVGQARANAWQEVSDGRVKTELREIIDCLETIVNLRPVSYASSRDDHKRRQLGLIAQEVLTVLAEVVDRPPDEETQFLGIHYNKIIPVLIAAVQELRGIQEGLITRLQKLETERS
jgi:hypothetical protein